MKQEIQRFLEVKAGYLTPRSIQTYKRSLAVFAELVDVPFSEVRDHHLSYAIIRLNERYKDTTVQNIMNAVHSLFKFWGPEIDCLNHERVHVPKALVMPRYAATEGDYRVLRAAIDTSSFRGMQQALMLELLWCTGMRVGELMSLPIAEIDFRGMKATVKTEKTMAFREVYWSRDAHKLLLKYFSIREQLDDGPFLFVSVGRGNTVRSRGHLTTRSVERWLKALVAECGLDERLVPHSMRHSRIQRWFTAGLNAYEVIMLTGHRSVTSLVHYMRLNNPINEANARRALEQGMPVNEICV